MRYQERTRKRTAKMAGSHVMFWFSLSLAFSVILGILALKQAFSSEYVVQDDMRDYIWMERFVDPELFPNDLLADYFESVTPTGHAALHRFMAGVGVDPLLLNKLLPIVLGLVITGYCFGVCMQMLPVPAAGFIASVLLNQSLWMASDLISASPRAFVYPLLLAFFYYLLRRSLLPCLVVIALQGLFYAPILSIMAGVLVLRLFCWEDGRLRLSRDRSDYLFCATGLAVVLFVGVLYVLRSSEFGPVPTAAETRQLPDFLPGGRQPFYRDNPLQFWLTGPSGIVPAGWLRMQLPLIFVGLLLPVLLRYPTRFPLTRQVTPGVTLLAQTVLASLVMFFVAHAVFFKLFFPNRYTWHSLRIVMALASGIGLMVLIDAAFNWAKQQTRLRLRGRQFLALGSAVVVGTVLLLQPVYMKLSGVPFPRTDYVVGREAQLYEFLSRQPKDILIASLAEEANNLPTFSKRSVLVSREYALSWHLGYYRQVSQRATDLIHAHYSPDLSEVQDFVQAYGIDFVLLDRTALTPGYVANHQWMNHYFQSATKEALTRLEEGDVPALSSVIEPCAVLETESLILLDAGCILKTSQG